MKRDQLTSQVVSCDLDNSLETLSLNATADVVVREVDVVANASVPTEPPVNGAHSFLGRRCSGAKPSCDLYETPQIATEKLIDVLFDSGFNIDGKTVLEPCHGKGAISNVLENLGASVIKRDLYFLDKNGNETDGIDPVGHNFLEEEIPECDMLITNPPYSTKHEFLEKILNSKIPFAMLLPFQQFATLKFLKQKDKSPMHFVPL